MRPNYYHVTPTRTLRGLLCGVLGTFAGTLAWLVIAAVSAALYPLAWAWAHARDRLAMPFDEARSVVWCSVMVAGAIAAFVTVADLWPAAEAAITRMAALAANR